MQTNRREIRLQRALTCLSANGEDAYERAGYTPDRRAALRLRARPEVDAKIKWLMAQKAKVVPDAKAEIKQAKVTPQWVMARLAENVEVCLGRRAAADGTYTYNPQDAALSNSWATSSACSRADRNLHGSSLSPRSIPTACSKLLRDAA